MKQIILACAMLEDELQKVLKDCGCELPVRWIERGYHNTPQKLKEKLQETIDGLQEYDEILLTFGLCGNGTEGIVSPRATLVMPRFDDCINMLLCHGSREQRGLIKTGEIYLTRGWTQDKEAILGQYKKNQEHYGQETAQAIMEMMYEHYERIAVIDTESYNMDPVLDYAQKAANLLDLSTETVKGSVSMLRQLITGPWDENFIVQTPGTPVRAAQWEFPVLSNSAEQ